MIFPTSDKCIPLGIDSNINCLLFILQTLHVFVVQFEVQWADDLLKLAQTLRVLDLTDNILLDVFNVLLECREELLDLAA